MLNPEIARILVGIGKGIVYGAIAAGIGYFKTQNSEGDLDNFDPKKFTQTVIIGMFIGGIAGSGSSMDDASNMIGTEFGIAPEIVKTFIMTSITLIADEIVKVVWRRFLSQVWTDLKYKLGR